MPVEEDIFEEYEEITNIKIRISELEKWKDKSWNMHQEMAQEILPNQLEILEKEISELQLKVSNPEWLDILILDLMQPYIKVLREFINHYAENLHYITMYTEMWDFSVEVCQDWLDKLDQKDGKKPSKKGCFNCKYFIDDNSHCEERDMDSYKEFQYTTFLTAICNNWTEKEPTEVAGSARQTEFELIEKFSPPRGITCKDCMNMGKDELKMKKADLEFLLSAPNYGNIENEKRFYRLQERYSEVIK